MITNPSAHEKEHRHARGRTKHAQAPAHGPPSGVVLDKAGENGADDASGRKGAVGDTIHLRHAALAAKDTRVFFFHSVDGVSDFGKHGGGDEDSCEADEGEKHT